MCQKGEIIALISPFCDVFRSFYGHENEVYNSMMSFCNVND